MLRALTAFALLYVLWLPLQPSFTWLVAAVAEPLIRLVEDPPLITSLTAEGNSVQLFSYLTGFQSPMASWSTETLGGFLLAPLVLIMALAAPHLRRAMLFWFGGLVLLFVFLVIVGIAVTQLKLVAETHASTVLGITLHTSAEQAAMKRINDALYVVGMLALPAFLCLATYCYVRWLPPAPAADSAVLRGRRFKRISILALAAGISVWVLFAVVPGPETDPDAYHEGWGKILRLNPQFAPAKVNVGLHLAGSGRLDEAIDLYRSALETSPELVEAHFNLGNALLDKGLPERAAASFLEAVRRAPAHAEAHRNLAVAYHTRPSGCTSRCSSITTITVATSRRLSTRRTVWWARTTSVNRCSWPRRSDSSAGPRRPRPSSRPFASCGMSAATRRIAPASNSARSAGS